jgi:hypothetical protein
VRLVKKEEIISIRVGKHITIRELADLIKPK